VRGADGANARFRTFATKLLLFTTAFLIIFLFGFGAIHVWSGLGKGEFRVNLGEFGAIPNLMTKFIVPALLAYAAILYGRTSRKGTSRVLWVANLLVVLAIGASWGFKATGMLVLLPALLLLYWRIRPRALIIFAATFAVSVILFFQVFDTSRDADTDILKFLVTRVTVLQGDVAWYIWGLHADGQSLPNYWPTLLAAFGDKTLSAFGLSRSDSFVWMLYHYDWLLTNLAGVPLDMVERGHNITATPFGEGLIAGGLAGVVGFAVLAGFLIGRLYRFVDRSLRRGHDVRAAIAATYFCFCVFPWLVGGGIVQLFHVSLLISIGSTLAVLTVMRRRWVLGPSNGKPPATADGLRIKSIMASDP
jgi:oligosaccharide repeat unit polymerase